MRRGRAVGRTPRKAYLTTLRTRAALRNGKRAAARTLAERRSPRVRRGPGGSKDPDARAYAGLGGWSQRSRAGHAAVRGRAQGWREAPSDPTKALRGQAKLGTLNHGT